MAKGSAQPEVRVDNRREELLLAAARLFAEHGFEATSMRDIAREVGMLAGSIYYHFSSKEELVAACHARGVAQIVDAVNFAILNVKEPWARLEAACVAHLEALLGDTVFAAVVLQDFSRLSPELRAQLVAQRDEYERWFGGLVDVVPLARRRDRRLLRLMLLGALNWTPTWYRANGAPPKEIARSFIAMLREGV
jgi:AcrR family transcriptional regulator